MTATEALVASGVLALCVKEAWALLHWFLNRNTIAAQETADLKHKTASTDMVNMKAAALAVVTATGLLDSVEKRLEDEQTRNAELEAKADRVLAESEDTRQKCEAKIAKAREELTALGNENAALQVALNDCLGRAS